MGLPFYSPLFAGSSTDACVLLLSSPVFPHQLKRTIQSTGGGPPRHELSSLDAGGDYYRTILHSAACSGDEAVVEAVTATVAKELDDDEVRKP